MKPPYSPKVAAKPYPTGYVRPQTFPEFNEKSGNAMVHFNKFRDRLGAFSTNEELCMREFSKSLTDNAHVWYTSLPAGLMHSWNEMTQAFMNKIYVAEEKVIILNLGREKKKSGEDLNAFVKLFREKTIDCVDSISESTKIKICMAGMLDDYLVFLENLGINSFNKLIDSYKRTAASLKK